MNDDDLGALISPWLGEDLEGLDGLPLPRLVAVSLPMTDNTMIEKFQNSLHEIAPNIRIDTHEDWLSQLLKLTRILRLIAVFVVLLIGGITVTAIAGGIRSRMAIHKEDVELLHLMGASDHYISRQFQRHGRLIALKGSISGVIIGALFLYITSLFAHFNSASTTANLATMPGIGLSIYNYASFLLLPIFAALLASYTAQFTVARALGRMP